SARDHDLGDHLAVDRSDVEARLEVVERAFERRADVVVPVSTFVQQERHDAIGPGGIGRLDDGELQSLAGRQPPITELTVHLSVPDWPRAETGTSPVDLPRG